jgi:lysophospholipase L1-like esterase
VQIERFVVLGDSCAEGIDDPYPDGSYRGWADLVAGQLDAVQPGLRYANLAVRGRRLDQIHAEQLPTACELRPDLVALFGGGNDVLQGSRWDAVRVRDCLEATVEQLSAVASTVLLFTLPETRWQRLGAGRLQQRVVLLNDAVESVAAQYDAVLLDVRHDTATSDRRYFGADRLHLSEHGHRRLAAHVLRRLGVPTTGQWETPLPAAPPVSLRQRVASDVRWLREFAAPAAYTVVRNRIVGRQPGDGFAPKRPELRQIAEP